MRCARLYKGLLCMQCRDRRLLRGLRGHSWRMKRPSEIAGGRWNRGIYKEMEVKQTHMHDGWLKHRDMYDG